MGRTAPRLERRGPGPTVSRPASTSTTMPAPSDRICRGLLPGHRQVGCSAHAIDAARSTPARARSRIVPRALRPSPRRGPRSRRTNRRRRRTTGRRSPCRGDSARSNRVRRTRAAGPQTLPSSPSMKGAWRNVAVCASERSPTALAGAAAMIQRRRMPNAARCPLPTR